MSVNFKPLGSRVLVSQNKAVEKTASGIIIPDNSQEKPLQGKVVAVGNGTKEEPMTLKVGDEVMWWR